MTIFRKSLLTLSAAALGFSAVLIISVLAFMDSLYYETNARNLKNTAETIFSIFSEDRLSGYFLANGELGAIKNTDSGADINNALESVIFNGSFPLKESAYRLTLINREGEVLWDSLVEGRIVNHLDREEVMAALEGREGSNARHSVSAGTRQIYFALPVRVADGEVAGVFRLSAAVPSFWSRVAPAALPFLVIAFLFLMMAIAGVFLFSRSLSRSLDRLMSIAIESAGEYWHEVSQPQISISGETREIAALEIALRGMVRALTRRIEQSRSDGRRLEAILNSMSEAVIAIDSKLLLSLVNQKARELFELDDRDLTGLSLLEAFRSTELEWAARRVLSTGQLEATELIHNGHCGLQRFQVFIAPLPPAGKDAAVNVEGIVMVLENLTRISKLEQIRKDFVANVSHELRTPIQLMKGFSETLLDSSLKDTGQVRRFIEIMRKNADTMENLISDLLSLASLENENSSRPEMEEMELAPIFNEAVSFVKVQAKKKNAKIVVDCDPGLKAKLYSLFITQALINLLDNAIKYSSADSRIWARAYRDNDELVLEVKDEGIGIPVEHLERIFERFYRIDRARSREAGGTGLGLSIVRHIAILHKGKAEVESHAGEGSVFRIRIPYNG